jgi:glycosyltransferase involved in cell wall biosynthesis
VYNVLFIASWYPSRVNGFDGDFIERHAKAISLYNNVFVIYVVKDPQITDGEIEIEKQVSGNLITYRGYYPNSGSKAGWIEKLHSGRWNFKVCQRIYKNIVHEFGPPDIVHLNVLMKAGLFAWWLKKKYRLPYVLSENWTGYYKERKDGYRQKSGFYKFLSRMVFRNCAYALPVTNDLRERMNELFGTIPSKVIPNVVDTSLFYPVRGAENFPIRLIHVSTLGYHKNIQGILRVTKKLYQCRQDFELYLAGPASDEIRQWTKEHGLLNTCVFFLGLIPYEQVAVHMRNADALIMFSRYENLPCVILEALACGLPVISTNVGGIREVIDDGNGVLVQSEQEDELLEAIHKLLGSLHLFDKQKIAFSAKKKFSFETVGSQFDQVYKELLAGKKG